MLRHSPLPPTHNQATTLVTDPFIPYHTTHTQQICEAVRESGQVVWAHTHHEDGLLGRKDLPLRTAVGAPICSIG